MIELSEEMRGCFPGNDDFTQVMALEGEIYRAKEGRRTLMFNYKSREYFAKIHNGIGWGEILKNLVAGKMPVIDASNEWEAVDLLERAGVDTVRIVGKGVRGWNPAKRQSFVIMEALEERVELEDFLKNLGGLTGARRLQLRRVIIRKVAESARRMHSAGMNHRDFYLCHFHILKREWSGWTPDENFRLPLLDLHRAQIRAKVPRRWLIKDLGALLFSAIDCAVTDRDMVAFLQVYLGEGWKQRLRHQGSLWNGVIHRADKFYQRHRGKPIKLPGVFSHL